MDPFDKKSALKLKLNYEKNCPVDPGLMTVWPNTHKDKTQNRCCMICYTLWLDAAIVATEVQQRSNIEIIF